MSVRACKRMLQDIEQEVRDTHQNLGFAALSIPVRQALSDVPRHVFVPDALQDAAYENRPLPIGEGQTISQPYSVAIMTELLALNPQHKVLEIGTGSGYQTALLACLAKRVYSIEIIQALASHAANRFEQLGFDNIEVHVGDGYLGWPQAAPFDAIIITAATDHIPPALLEQLKSGGRLIAPLGSSFGQELILFCKAANGDISAHRVLPVAFVAMTGLAQTRSESLSL